MEIKTVSKKRKLLPGLDMTQEEFIARVRKSRRNAILYIGRNQTKNAGMEGTEINPVIEGGELTIDEFKSMVKVAEKNNLLYFGRRTRNDKTMEGTKKKPVVVSLLFFFC